MTNFPTSLDVFTNPSSTDTQDVIPHATQHENHNTAIEALEAKVWVNGSAVTTSLDYKTSRLTTKGDILTHDWTNPIRQEIWSNGYMLVADNTKATGLNWIATTNWGTVTTTSVTSANWFAWTVSNPTTTPSITLSTTITWVLKGNWTAISAASAWTDYYAPWSTDVAVADGWTWVSSLTAYAPIFWGTTSTWAIQSGTVWTSGQVLTSNGAWALPTFQNVWSDFTYSGSLKIATASSNWTWVDASTHYQTNWLTVWTCVLSRWTSGYAKLRYSPDNATWTDILNVSTAWGYTFPILMRKGYYYYVEVDSPIWWTASTASLTFM